MSRRNWKKSHKVWLTREQIENLESVCNRVKDLCIIQLGAWVGLRSNEIASIKQRDLRQYTIDGRIKYFVMVEGKRTRQKKGDGLTKTREAFIPKRVYNNIQELIDLEKLQDIHPIVPNKFGKHYSTTGIQQRVKRMAMRVYDKTDDREMLYVSSHDLRRFFAHYNLEEKSKNPRVVMAQGGWSGWHSIEPYLHKPSRDKMVSELEDD